MVLLVVWLLASSVGSGVARGQLGAYLLLLLLLLFVCCPTCPVHYLSACSCRLPAGRRGCATPRVYSSVYNVCAPFMDQRYVHLPAGAIVPQRLHLPGINCTHPFTHRKHSSVVCPGRTVQPTLAPSVLLYIKTLTDGPIHTVSQGPLQVILVLNDRCFAVPHINVAGCHKVNHLFTHMHQAIKKKYLSLQATSMSSGMARTCVSKKTATL